MRTSNISAGDLVLCDVLGRRFVAEVLETGVELPGRKLRGLRIGPAAGATYVTYTNVAPSQVLKHFKQMKTSSR